MSEWSSSGIRKSVSVAGIVLAAGKGTRMKSQTMKVLHKVAGRSIISLVLSALRDSGISDIVAVVSDEQRNDEKFLNEIPNTTICTQLFARGTADAVASSAHAFAVSKMPNYAKGELIRGDIIDSDYVLICAGDTPCLQGNSLREFITNSLGADLTVLATHQSNPTGYGRLITQGSELISIVEEKDCNEFQKKINLVNTGIYLVRTHLLFQLLDDVLPNNAQNEYYLTDIVKLARASKNKLYNVQWKTAGEPGEYSGVNDREQLAIAERFVLEKIRNVHMQQGVTMHLPETIYIDRSVKIGRDCEIGAGNSIIGATEIGSRTKIGHHVVLRDVVLGNDCYVGDCSFLEGCLVGDGEIIQSGTIRKLKN
jgi:bifunctional UDP-N-acetylglucosamine pyrophosphorylase/glucosamine-1-phosphate N-acetyltransferase